MKDTSLFLSMLLIFSGICESKAIKPATTQDFVVGNLRVGQLGNQCFIIAAAVSLALDHNATALFPDLREMSNFDLPINYEKIFFRLNTASVASHLIKSHYQEPSYTYQAIPFVRNMEISGHFQSENHFRHHKEEIINLFSPSREIVDYLHDKYDYVFAHPVTVAVHVRSYNHEDPLNNYYTCTRDYYEKAMQYFPEDALFVVFSNKMEWCKEMLRGIPRQMVFIEGEAHYHDFYFMSLCTHNIICNSTFSWWSAYLNRNWNKIVVCPHTWFNPWALLNTKDLIPEEWYIIEY